MSTKPDASKPPGLQIGQVLVTHVEFSHTMPEPLSVDHETPHNVTSLMLSAQMKTTENEKAAVLRVRVGTDPEKADALYKFVVEVAALVTTVEAQENLPPSEYLGQAGMSILYPFLREAIANVTTRGRFGPVWLQPINLRLATQSAQQKKPKKKAAKKKRQTKGK